MTLAEKDRVADDCVMVICGAAGDLTRRLLLPSLCNLGAAGLLSDKFTVVGFAHKDFTTESFRDYFIEDVKEFVKDEKAKKYGFELAQRTAYLSGEFNDPAVYQKLKELLESLATEKGTSRNCIFYLATPPRFFCEIVENLGLAELTTEQAGQWRRVIIEKPFGHDLASAKKLNQDISKFLKEDQIYRIDHYLGKETVQNIIAFRFANGIFEPIWNRRYIDHVQITVAESLGVETRGNYYETSGAARDMVPNHLMQLLSLTAMEPPISLSADAVRDEKSKLLRAIEIGSHEEILSRSVRGQYGAGFIDNKSVPAYRAEPSVDPHSMIETFVAMKLNIDNWRWAGVPFYVRTGKRMEERSTEIAIQFRSAPSILFKNTPTHLAPNQLILHVQPNEGITLNIGAKVPGPIVKLGEISMTMNYKDYFGASLGTGYETLLYDCMNGDGTLFQRADMVELGWELIQPMLDVWQALPARSFPNYAAGSWGPKESDDLLKRDGRKWRKG